MPGAGVARAPKATAATPAAARRRDLRRRGAFRLEQLDARSSSRRGEGTAARPAGDPPARGRARRAAASRRRRRRRGRRQQLGVARAAAEGERAGSGLVLDPPAPPGPGERMPSGSERALLAVQHDAHRRLLHGYTQALAPRAPRPRRRTSISSREPRNHSGTLKRRHFGGSAGSTASASPRRRMPAKPITAACQRPPMAAMCRPRAALPMLSARSIAAAMAKSSSAVSMSPRRAATAAWVPGESDEPWQVIGS